MALVMLPCDLPWWDSVKEELKKISLAKSTVEVVRGMQQIYELCNVSLDPEEDTVDPEQYMGFLRFVEEELTCEEKSNLLEQTFPNIVTWALRIKELRPPDGVYFSLQQQGDIREVEYSLAASILANAFFSTFPKRTDKTHPTLQNINFASFFKTLQTGSAQKAKLRSVLHYFDWIENSDNRKGSFKIYRQVMHSKEWLTIDDWLECGLRLCPLQIKHETRLENSDPRNLMVCFASTKIGGQVLGTGCSQESINMFTMPELLTLMLSVEALEDNEVVTVHGARQMGRITSPKRPGALFEKFDNPKTVNVCFIDADDFAKLPICQHTEDNILRELNKCFLAFQQKTKLVPEAPYTVPYQYNQRHRRLSPIGESIGSNKSEGNSSSVPVVVQPSCSTTKTDSLISEDKSKLQTSKTSKINEPQRGPIGGNFVGNRRGRFIVLGSSGEQLPISRILPHKETPKKVIPIASCSSSDDDFHSAKSSLDDGSDDEHFNKRYSIDLETAEQRYMFAQKLREALENHDVELPVSSSEESNYAVDISLTGSAVVDKDIKVKRGGSIGFALKEDSQDDYYDNSLAREKEWIEKFKSNQISKIRSKKGSSDYSFSTEYSSELEDIYEQFSHWVDNPISETGNKLEARDLAVVRFASSLLKRTLSESYAGVPVPLTEGGDRIPDSTEAVSLKKDKIALIAKSLSLELARQKHRLAAQLVSSLEHTTTDGLQPVSTGNWGCGSSCRGDVQLKMVIQWMAASVSGIPFLCYYTHKHEHLTKLDTLCRILIDRKWTVKDLSEATLRYSNRVLLGKELSGALFEELIGIDKNSDS